MAQLVLPGLAVLHAFLWSWGGNERRQAFDIIAQPVDLTARGIVALGTERDVTCWYTMF